ncbi:hypothetical protein M3P05_19920 [Sansalvadorimonas sp. 2012CJ34-2]|uniref:Uncharacterized protein n=1 Tax=Parendozoicomonas callyspongiae TaxID=2942213 RepID=A0ABT0PLE1_9GAMM|nr:hypothetical protein [Sansalvadorimonas sp. 2012CJ34-2]MCL6272192.1 hypothetical protein [Sansalvadorimonas sp. 2012CJ34-2]
MAGSITNKTGTPVANDPQILRADSHAADGQGNGGPDRHGRHTYRRFNGRSVQARNVEELLSEAQRQRRSGDDTFWSKTKRVVSSIGGDLLTSAERVIPQVLFGGFAAKGADIVVSASTGLPVVGDFIGNVAQKLLIGESIRVCALTQGGDRIIEVGANARAAWQNVPTASEQRQATNELVQALAEDQKIFRMVTGAALTSQFNDQTTTAQMSQAMEQGEALFDCFSDEANSSSNGSLGRQSVRNAPSHGSTSANGGPSRLGPAK